MSAIKRETSHRLRIAAFCLLAFCAVPLTAHSATLPTSPLFLGTSVEPNIFFLLDDSGSMDWSTMASGPHGLPTVSGVTDNGTTYNDISSFFGYLFPNPYRLYTAKHTTDQCLANQSLWYSTGSGYTDCPYSGVLDTQDITSPTSDAWRVRNYHYNGVYYDPAITYKPWPGTDANGNPLYTNANPKAAPYDPNNPSGATLDLEDSTSVTASSGTTYTVWPARYYTWTDTNSTASLSGNGVVDGSDTHTLVNIEPSVNSYTGSASRTDCANAPTCTYAEEIQNYANWFTYYRTHLDAAKATIGTVVDGSDASRMGLWLYNYGLLDSASSMGSSSNKLSLLQTLYGHTISAQRTPARRALQSLGNYFMSSDGPILSQSQGGECQQNFDVMVTDGYWNGSTPSPTVGDQDKDGYSNTLADVADYYYKTDLSSLANDVPTSAADTNSAQHLDTFGVAFGAAGTLDPATTDPATVTWPQPKADEPTTVDDLYHATYDGHGKFVYAQNSSGLASALSNALATISNRAGTAAALSFNGATLATASALYQVTFNSSDWTGNLIASAIDSSGNISATPTWQAQTQLDAQSASSRTILTYKNVSANNATATGIPFQWNDLSSTEKTALETNPSGGTDSATEGEARLNYLRGDRSNEGTNGYKFRARDHVLGDIIHSSAVYVGAPNLGWPNTSPFPVTAGSTYSDFITNEKNRTPMVYVGANDGMLHGFDANTGNESLAYVPSNLFSSSADAGLHFLTDPTYTHRYYVDLTPSVSDAYIHTSADASGVDSWHTVLVGGERGGGRGYFALDVTDPSNFSESNAANTVLWEFTNQNDADLGYTFSKPQIALLNNGRWAAIFGSGVNTANDGSSGVGALYIVFLDGENSDGTWTQCPVNNKYTGCGYIKLSTGVGTTSAPDDVFTPALVDTNGDGTADRVYVGDSDGNMWVFDLSNSDPSKWGSAFKQGSTPEPLFTTPANQPITVQPQVATNPKVTGSNAGSNAPNLLVLFGTGQYLYDADKTTTDTQAFYGVWDNGSNSTLTTANLVQQTLTDVTVNTSSTSTTTTTARVATSHAVDYTGANGTAMDGWYVDLGSGITNSPASDAGERVVTPAVVRNGYIWFNTMIPIPGGCSGGGDGYLMSLDLGTGGDPGRSLFDLNGDTYVNSSDLVSYTDSSGNTQQSTAVGEKFNGGLPSSPAFLGNKRYTAGTNGTAIAIQAIASDTVQTGRRSWQELSNN